MKNQFFRITIPIAGCDRDASYINSWATGEAHACQTIIFRAIKGKTMKIQKIITILFVDAVRHEKI